jgi:putative heme-binding domain-containing protein
VWRYHVEQDRFELFAEGGGNMWGLDFDSAGQLITSTNLGGYTSMHAVQGGYYWKSFGKHGPLHHPYAFGYFDHIPCERFEGGHVSVGGLFYASDGLPERYRGQYLYANLLSHSLAQQRLEPLGSTFRGGPTQEWIRSNDSWFAPTDLCVGPDGGVYVSDWHDRRTAHPDPDADWDRTNGRIYRLRGRSETARRWTEIKDSIAALMDADGWRYRRALRQISDGPDRYRPDPLLEELKSWNSVAVLRGIWGLHALGSWNDELACGMLDHESPDVRAWTIRLAGDWPDRFPALIHRLPAVAREDSSPRVWSQLASTARRLPADEGMSILLELVHRGELAADPLVPLLVWWGIEEHASQDLARWVPKIQRQRGVESALYRDVVLPRLMKRCVAEGSPTGWQAFRLLLDEADEATARTGMLSFAEGMDLTPSSARPGSDQTLSRFAQGKDAKGAPPAEQRTVPAEIRELVGLHWQRHREDPIFQRAAIDAGLIEARTTLTQWAGDPTQPLDRRRQSVQLLARWGGKDLLDLADLLLRPNSPPELQKEALLLLGRIDDDSVADRLLGAYATSSDSLRSDIRAVMTTRAGWTRRLLVEVEAGRISLASIPLDEVRRMVGTEDEQVLAAVGRLWGAVRSGTPEEKLAEVRRLNNDLNAAQGSLAAGRQLYLTHCSQCHQLFGEGSAVGPELTHANRQDREFLLVSLVDPSLTIRKEYVSLTCELRDGRVLQGVVTQQQGETITLVDSHARPTTLARGDIVEIKESLVSLMPEDLYRKLSPQELRDLFAYVQSDGLARTDAEKESGH